ncbi:MAG TPA: class I SAM-dependent methyltransferase [Tepidisphaeraceae bacterium]|jgi:SAM-dependent methyltransferase|nr:class I SAM-dependent methyltransferase [Tepidisphaeraceae bacterium]
MAYQRPTGGIRGSHDGWTFEELAGAYNYDNTSDRRATLVDLVVQESRKRATPVCILDIGCGTGISEDAPANVAFLKTVRDNCQQLWGIEPDANSLPTHGMFDRLENTTMELADLPDGSVDIAFSYFVMEHVDEPDRFMRAVCRCLKPGGCYIFMTPNARHYFTIVAKFFKTLGISDTVVRLLRGKALTESYHYPVRYKFNSPKTIDKSAAAAGLATPEYAYIERDAPRGYFPGPTVAICWLLAQKRKVLRKPKNLLELICRVQKPAECRGPQ